MKFEINTVLLQAICSKAVKAVSTKDIIPALKNFLIEATEDNIKILAGDSVTYVEKNIPCNDVTEPGIITVDGKDLTKLISKINSETVVIETTEDNKIRVKAGKSKFHLKIIDPEEYVYPENVKFVADGLTANLIELQKALRLGSITVSKNATEVYFTGYKIGKNIVTTNRNNMMLYEMPLTGDDLLLSPDIVALINDLDGDTVEFGYNGDYIEFRVPGTKIMGNLICGIENFPPDELLSQFNYEKVAKVAKKDIVPILERAMIFVDNIGAAELNFGAESTLKIQLVGAHEVDTYEEIAYNGNMDIAINVNVAMLLNICASVDTDILEFHIDSSDTPLLIKAGNYTALMASMSVGS